MYDRGDNHNKQHAAVVQKQHREGVLYIEERLPSSSELHISREEVSESVEMRDKYTMDLACTTSHKSICHQVINIPCPFTVLGICFPLPYPILP